MSSKTFFSNRIYKNNLNLNTVSVITENIEMYNSMVHSVYNRIVLKNRNNKPLTDSRTDYYIFSDKFGDKLTPYQRNSAIQEAKAIYKSQQELRKLYIKDLEFSINEIDKKIKSTQKVKTELQNIKNSLKLGETPKNKKYFLSDRKVKSGKNRYYDSVYLFEHQYLEPQLKKLRSRIGVLTHKKRVKQQKLDKLKDKSYIPSIVFGSKNLFKQSQIHNGIKYTKKQKKIIRKKLKQFQYKRSYRMDVSGRADSICGNFVFSYIPENNILYIKLKDGIHKFENVNFKYGQPYIDKYFKNQKINKNKSISWSIEDYGNYYIVKCSLDIDYGQPEHSVNGILGIDNNLGFYSVAEISDIGNFISATDYQYQWQKLTSEQLTKQIEKTAIDIVQLAKDKHMSIAIEDTKIYSKPKIYKSKAKNNFKLKTFAHRKMLSSIISRCEKEQIQCILINPAYTSFIGKVKYNPVYRKSTHQMAAYVIGRKALNFKEKIPKKHTIDTIENRTNLDKWKTLYKKYKKVS